MRPEFLKAVEQLEYEDRLFQASLSTGVMMATSLETWAVAREVAEKLYEVVIENQPQTIVEVGTSLGYSTLWLAEAALTYGGKVITIEKEPSKFRKTKLFFGQMNYGEALETVHADAKEYLQSLSGSIDLLFLDALKREYTDYLKAAEVHMPQGGILLADDVIEWKRKLQDFFDYLNQNNTFSYNLLPLGHGLLVGTKRV